MALADLYCDASIIPADQRHVYEIIKREQPCVAYFDLEYARNEAGLNAQRDGDALTRCLIQAATRILVDAFERQQTAGVVSPRLAPEPHAARASEPRAPPAAGGGCDQAAESQSVAREALAALSAQPPPPRPSEPQPQPPREELVVETVALDSHQPSKFSRHLMLRPVAILRDAHGDVARRTPLLLSGNAEAGWLARAVCEELGEQLIVDERKSFVDLTVYDSARNFRLVGSSKIRASAPAPAPPALRPNMAFTTPELTMEPCGRTLRLSDWTPDGEPTSDSLRDWFDASLVIPRAEGAPLLRLSPLSSAPASASAGASRALVAASSSDAGASHASTRAGGAMSVHRTSSAEDVRSRVDEWRAAYVRLTDSPLLDLKEHPFIQFKAGGNGTPRPPFEALARWAAAQFQSWAGAQPSASVREWRYRRSEFPMERVIHMTASGTKFCFHLCREHKSQRVMISVDLNSGQAWQRCWDHECSIVVDKTDTRFGGKVLARHYLGQPPADCLPTYELLHKFELEFAAPQTDIQPQAILAG